MAAAFVGVDKLKRDQAKQRRQFEKWVAAENFARLHSSHYDWWMFPLNETSTQPQYTLTAEALASLREDADFVASLRRGAVLLAAAWGWDLLAQTPLTGAQAEKGQKWARWPVRLYKAGRCMRLFGQADLYAGFRAYAEWLVQRGEDLRFYSSARRTTEDVLPLWSQLEESDRSTQDSPPATS